MRVTGFFFLLFCLFAACSNQQDHRGRTPLVEISGNVLYEEDLRNVLPVGLSKDDSLLFAERYIRNWVEDILLYNLAESNIPNSDEIDRLTESYKKALIVHAYQQALIDQKISTVLTEEEMLSYYEDNKALFIVDQPMIKGLFIKVPVTSKGLGNVRNWYKKNTPQNVEALEKYSLNNAVSYDYFYDRWTAASDVMSRIPVAVDDLNSYLKTNKHIEVKDTEFYYFLNVEEVLETGSIKPFELAGREIRTLLSGQKQIAFMKDLKNDLYQRAVKGNKINYYY